MVEFRIHDWLKTSCRKGLQVQVLLIVRLCLRGAMGDTADLGSVAIWYEGSSPFAGKIMVQWCNWETRQIKVLMPRGMRVRFSPEPDNVSLAELVYAAASKAVPVRGMSSTLIRNIILG